jgi:hypothetical protein
MQLCAQRTACRTCYCYMHWAHSINCYLVWYLSMFQIFTFRHSTKFEICIIPTHKIFDKTPMNLNFSVDIPIKVSLQCKTLQRNQSRHPNAENLQQDTPTILNFCCETLQCPTNFKTGKTLQRKWVFDVRHSNEFSQDIPTHKIFSKTLEQIWNSQ